MAARSWRPTKVETGGGIVKYVEHVKIPKIGEDEPNFLRIFFTWVETTNYRSDFDTRE